MKRAYANNFIPKNTSKATSGFTIVELLIVIVVIGILAAISIVAYNNVQDRAAVAVLQSDLSSASKQIALTRVEEGIYPASANTVNQGNGLNSSKGSTLNYYQLDGGEGYCLMARSDRSSVEPQQISSTTGSVKPGACASYAVPPDSSAGDFVFVPGNPDYGTSSFYVAKYEAKNVAGKAVSQSAGTPWVNINQADARTAATNACSGCRLITDPEWMTVAMNLVNNPANWSGGSVGSGYIYSGNSNSSAAMDGSNPLSGINTRPLKLSTGEEIWDIAGNVWEWTDATISGGQPGKAGQSSYGWTYYNDGTLGWNSLSVTSRPAGTLYSNSQGVGGIYSNPGESSTRAFRRGGSWDEGSDGGVWALRLNTSPSSTSSYVGFRVTR